ncbi:hypothetical protein DID88_007979 [Monilinia fructigena]|uniref:Uncharacterized protein n=1 Tax=Monilinia fructigena TaxID=38457 RepID=A0A395J3Z4_9HELO|nr:hypothetical protein DID88_007979 [Monilinia fructigena]
MPSGQSNGNFISNVQATTPSRPYHQRESSLSTLGSPGAPASPFAPSTSNPLVVGDSYHEFQDYPHTYQKSLTPTHTPLQANSRWPGTPTYTQDQNNLTSTMSNINDTQRLMSGNNELMAAPEFHSRASHEDERQQFAHGSLSRQMPKLTRTTTDAYDDELYLGYPTVSTPSPAHASTRTSSAPANDIFAQRLQAANQQHLTSNKKKSSALSPREQSPFQPGSPLAPSTASFNPQSTFGMKRVNSEQVTPKTISPKDVDLVYHEEDDANIQSFPPLPQHGQLPMAYRSQSIIPHEPSESEDMSLSQQSYGSMATTRRESSSTYSTSSQSTSRQSQMAFNTSPTPTVPQHYPFAPSTQRQTSNMSNVSNMSDMSDMSHDFPAAMTSMESGNSEIFTGTRNSKTIKNFSE